MARVVSAMLVSPMELSPEMEAALGAETQPEPLSVAARQEKLLERLNLDGLAHWPPENAVAVRELVLAYHDVFALESNELGCTSAIEHEIRIENDEPFKERFWHIPPPLLKEVCTCHPCLEEGWYPVFLHGLQVPQHTYEKGLIPPATDSGGPGNHGGVSAFLVDGFQVRLLADQDGPRIATVHSLYGWKPWVLQVYPHAIQAVQCTGNISASHAEHLRGAEPYVLCHLLGQCHSLRPHGRGAPGVLVHGVREVPRVQFEA